jgi:hypothetical protein
MKPSISKLKKKADAIFSQYIRLKNSDWRGYCTCYTCGKISHYKKLQCGHFEKRGNNATRYDEENCRVQCVGCNVFQAGNYPIFSHKLDQEDPTLRPRLREKASQIKQWKAYELEEIIATYRAKVKEFNI